MYSAPTPLLSVVIPSHRYGAFIAACLDSLCSSPVPLDIIVVENGSFELDDSLAGVVEPHDFRLVHVDKADLSAARNVGLGMARGEFVLFLDADDVLDIGVVIDALRSPEMSRCDAVCFDKREFESASLRGQTPPSREKTAYRHLFPRRWSRKTGVEFILTNILANTYSTVTGRFAFRRTTIELNRLLFAEGYIHEDHAFVFRFLKNAECLLVTRQIALHKRRHNESLSLTTSLTKSVEGYLQAATEIRATIGEPRITIRHADLAARAVETRLLYIVAKKKARLAQHGGTMGDYVLGIASIVFALFNHVVLLPFVTLVVTQRNIARRAM